MGASAASADGTVHGQQMEQCMALALLCGPLVRSSSRLCCTGRRRRPLFSGRRCPPSSLLQANSASTAMARQQLVAPPCKHAALMGRLKDAGAVKRGAAVLESAGAG